MVVPPDLTTWSQKVGSDGPKKDEHPSQSHEARRMGETRRLNTGILTWNNSPSRFRSLLSCSCFIPSSHAPLFLRAAGRLPLLHSAFFVNELTEEISGEGNGMSPIGWIHGMRKKWQAFARAGSRRT
jgi:hypothetical protein